MRHLRVFLSRLSALVRPGRMDREIDEEIESHIAEATSEYIERGLSPEDARSAACRSFGGVTQTKEVYRRVGSFVWLEDSWRDLRHALRTLRRSPAFTTAATATLALAIGTNTAMFSVLNGVLLRPLPYRSPEQLAVLWTEDPTQNRREGRSSLWDVEQWRSQSRSFADLATFDSVSTTLTASDGAEQVAGASISPNLLPLLGVRPLLGRSFSSEEAGQRERLVLISHRFWQARFGGSHDAIGATLVLNGFSCQVIGVLPAGFRIAELDADVWEPHPSRESASGPETWFVVGRLRPDVMIDEAREEMNAVARRLNNQRPAAERNRGINVVPLSLHVVGPESRLALLMLGGAVFCVFLIAAANVTSLSLARGVVRAREMAIRAALGASAGRIVRQLLTEALLLAAISGLIGTLLAFAGVRLIRTLGPGILPRVNEISLDVRVLAWALAFSALAGILVGLAPAIAALRRDVRPSGEDGARLVTGASTRRTRRALVVAEYALATVLLVGAGLLLRSWSHATGIDPGLRSERVLMMEFSAPATFSVAAQRTDLYARVLDQVRAVPGVENAGIIGDLFIANSRERVVTVERNDGTVSERLRFAGDEVSVGFFEAVGASLLRGRLFSSGDGADTAPVAIVNDALARRSWAGQDPVGRRLKVGPRDSGGGWYTVVGVVADMRRQGPEREAFPQMFVPLAQSAPPSSVDVLIRTSSDAPLAMAGAVRAAVRRVEKKAPIYGVTPLDSQLGTYLAERRFWTSVLTGFAVVALLIAAVGIYGLIQYSVSTRTREIGLRMAVGAQAGDIFRMVIGEGLALSLTGLALGLLGAVWLARASSSLLFGVTSSDPMTFAAVSLFLATVAVAGCCVPARRATTVDPVTSLRSA